MSDHEVRKPDWKDNLATGFKVVGSCVPYAEGPIIELLNIVNDRTLLGRRVREFLEKLNKVVIAHGQELEGLSPEKLSQNEAFISTLLHAIQAANRSHQKEKLEALCNAVLNSDLPAAPKEDMQLIFINLPDSMTASHIRILLFLADPRSFLGDQVSEREGLQAALLDTYVEKAFLRWIVISATSLQGGWRDVVCLIFISLTTQKSYSQITQHH